MIALTLQLINNNRGLKMKKLTQQQAFEKACEALNEGAKSINTLRDLNFSGDLPLLDYLELMNKLHETWQLRLKEGLKKEEFDILKRGA